MAMGKVNVLARMNNPLFCHKQVTTTNIKQHHSLYTIPEFWGPLVLMTVATLTLKVSGLPAGRRFNQSSMLSKVITSTSSWCNRLSGRKHFCKLKTWGLGLLAPVCSRLWRSESQEEGENAVGWEENWEGDWSGDWSTIPFLKCRRHQGLWSVFERLPNGKWLS